MRFRRVSESVWVMGGAHALAHIETACIDRSEHDAARRGSATATGGGYSRVTGETAARHVFDSKGARAAARVLP